MELNRSEIINMAADRIEYTLLNYSDSVNEDNIDRTEIKAIANRWFEAKQDKIYALMNHPHYQESEPFKVVYPVSYPRELDLTKINTLSGHITTIEEYTNDKAKSNFLKRILKHFGHTFIDEEDCIFFEAVAQKFELTLKAKPHEGQKVSKFIRKLASELGYTFVKKENYEDNEYTINEVVYAEYADALNPTMFERKCVLSVDPVDYLTMSNGNSWSSCYTINRDWGKGSENYQGCFSSGMWSYMTDKVTMIAYVVSESVYARYAEAPKILRQNVMYDDGGYMVNSRLYPAKSENEVYKSIRACTQKMISDTFNVPNMWRKSSEIEFEESMDYVGYNDLDHYRSLCVASVNTSTELAEVKDKTTKEVKKILPKRKLIGGKATCPCCGEEVDERYICRNCEEGRVIVFCEDCGHEIDLSSDNYLEYNGNYYCEDCYSTCEHCGECVPSREMEAVQGRRYEEWWCENCRDDDAFYCDFHERYESDDWYVEMEVTTSQGYHNVWCSEAAEENGAWQCENCGEWFTSVCDAHEGCNGNYYCNDCWEERKAEEDEES